MLPILCRIITCIFRNIKHGHVMDEKISTNRVQFGRQNFHVINNA
jgi:hypothetical protein